MPVPLNGSGRVYNSPSLPTAPGHSIHPAATAEPALGPYLRAIRAHRAVVIFTTLAFLAAAVFWLSFVRTPSYEATANLLVTPLPQDDETFRGLQLLRDSGDPTRTLQTAASLVTSPEAARRTADALGDGWSTQRVLDSVNVEPQGESNILAVTGSADDPDLAARLANTFAEETLAVRRDALNRDVRPLLGQLRERRDALGSSDTEAAAQLEDRINQLESVGTTGNDPTLSVSQEAEVPLSSSGAGAPVIIVLALLAGLALGAAAAVLMELLDRRIRDEDEALAILPLPVLARVPLVRRHLGRLRENEAWTLPPAVREACRTLLLQLPPRTEEGGRVVMVTSASTGDGKTTSAINLAATMAGAGQRVIVLDLDLRKADVAQRLAVAQPVHLNELLAPELDLLSLLRTPASLPSVSVLATELQQGDAILLEALYGRLPQLVAEARAMADQVIIDTPPLGEISDALRLLEFVDEILIVVRPGNSDRVGLSTTADLLARTRTDPAGFLVVGGTPGPTSSYYAYGRRRELFIDEPPLPERTSPYTN
jgi:Mrp family chromosome partitioning ATPase/capsular polysaccharide biosynthesis protein